MLLPLLTDGDGQSVGICILGDESAEDVLRLLKAGNVVRRHPLVELIEIRDTQARPASSCGCVLRIILGRTGPGAESRADWRSLPFWARRTSALRSPACSVNQQEAR